MRRTGGMFGFISGLAGSEKTDQGFSLLRFRFRVVARVLYMGEEDSSGQGRERTRVGVPQGGNGSFLTTVVMMCLFFYRQRVFNTLFVLATGAAGRTNRLCKAMRRFVGTGGALHHCYGVADDAGAVVQGSGNGGLVMLSSSTSGTSDFGSCITILSRVRRTGGSRVCKGLEAKRKT